MAARTTVDGRRVPNRGRSDGWLADTLMTVQTSREADRFPLFGVP